MVSRSQETYQIRRGAYWLRILVMVMVMVMAVPAPVPVPVSVSVALAIASSGSGCEGGRPGLGGQSG